MISFVKKSFGFFFLTLIGFFTPKPLYRTIASRPTKRIYVRFFQGLLGFSLYTAVLIDLRAPLIFLVVFVALMPLMMMSVAIDPFVSWLRGDDQSPWHTFVKYLGQGLWSILITIQPFILSLLFLIIVNPEFLTIFDDSDIENAQSIEDMGLFLVFSFFLTIHFFYSQAMATERKQHKFASIVVFAGVYLVIPAVTILVSGY